MLKIEDFIAAGFRIVRPPIMPNGVDKVLHRCSKETGADGQVVKKYFLTVRRYEPMYFHGGEVRPESFDVTTDFFMADGTGYRTVRVTSYDFESIAAMDEFFEDVYKRLGATPNIYNN